MSKPLNAEQQEALEIAMRYTVYNPSAWYEKDMQEMSRLVQIVYDRPASRFEKDGSSSRSVASKIVQDAIARVGFFAPRRDWWTVGLWAYTVLSTLLTLAVWGYLLAGRK